MRHCLPYSDEITAYPVPDTALRYPIEFELYIGNFDPQDHIDSYCNAMVVMGYRDAVLCRVFLLMLKKEALRWFKALPLANHHRTGRFGLPVKGPRTP